jgi:hypothetical protein
MDNYSSDEDVIEVPKEFTITDNIIDKKDDNTILCKINFIDIVSHSTSWCYNRKIYEEKVDELFNELQYFYDIPYILHGIYDDTKETKKILILDGQHRINAINLFIVKKNIEISQNTYVWIWLYKIDNSETINVHKAISIFRKINNNRLLEEGDLPDEFMICIINELCKVPLFKKCIGQKANNNTCRSPLIHKKELNEALNVYKKELHNKRIDMIIRHIVQMNDVLAEKTFDELYEPRYRKTEAKRYEKAKEIGFYLNLKNSKYSILQWIKEIL